jgi:hypothetical protein
MTLRKEISDFIRLTRNGAYTSDMITSDILTMIERRIDSMYRPTTKYATYSAEEVDKIIDKTIRRVKEILK